MRTIKELIRKLDLTLADLQADGGAIPRASLDRFIEVAIEDSPILRAATRMVGDAPEWDAPRIRFANRVLVPDVEGSALPAAQRSRPSLGFVRFTTKAFKAEVRLNNFTLEDNVERAALERRVVSLVGKATARDMGDVTLNGDTTSATPLLAQFNGLRIQSPNVLNVGGSLLTKSVVRDAIKTMPDEFKANLSALWLVGAHNAVHDLRDQLASKDSPLGDQMLSNANDISIQSVRIVPDALMPETLGATGDETEALLFDPKNVHFGVWKDVSFERDKDISAGEVIIVVRARFVTMFAVPEATVRITGIRVAA